MRKRLAAPASAYPFQILERGLRKENVTAPTTVIIHATEKKMITDGQ
jgi:hypothetical protein